MYMIPSPLRPITRSPCLTAFTYDISRSAMKTFIMYMRYQHSLTFIGLWFIASHAKRKKYSYL